jgi:hypothetical protein
VLADQISGRAPGIDTEGLAMARYGRTRRPAAARAGLRPAAA